MRCPDLSELPASPANRSGWPWTQASTQLAEGMPGGEPWPRVSIVTPSYNQGRFLEETIRSVLLQGYPDLEYIVVDGQSGDESQAIIAKYGPWLSYWVSEPDRGQAHAINKGFARMSGDIVTYLNSDDVYEPGALCQVAEFLCENGSVGLVYGDSHIIDADGQSIQTLRAPEIDPGRLLIENYIPQPSAFVRRSILDEIEPFDESLRFVLDWDLWLRLVSRTSCRHLDRFLSRMRFHTAAKSIAEDWTLETGRLLARVYAGPLPADMRASERCSRAMQHYRHVVAAFDRGQLGAARRAALASLKADFLGPRTPARLGYLCGCYLPEWLALAIRRVIHRLRWPKIYLEIHEQRT